MYQSSTSGAQASQYVLPNVNEHRPAGDADAHTGWRLACEQAARCGDDVDMLAERCASHQGKSPETFAARARAMPACSGSLKRDAVTTLPCHLLSTLRWLCGERQVEWQCHTGVDGARGRVREGSRGPGAGWGRGRGASHLLNLPRTAEIGG